MGPSAFYPLRGTISYRLALLSGAVSGRTYFCLPMFAKWVCQKSITIKLCNYELRIVLGEKCIPLELTCHI
jgi:hypothetical protein